MSSPEKIGILVAGSDAHTLRQLNDILETAGFSVHSFDTGRGIPQRITEGDIDIVMLDVVLPDTSGIGVLARLRQTSDIGIVMTGGPDDRDKSVISLEVGADDFLFRPFEARELIARLHAVLRRSQSVNNREHGSECAFRFEHLTMYPYRREVVTEDKMPLSMSSTEFSLLETFVRNPNEILTREKLLNLTYGDGISISERAIDVHVNRLRRKIENDPKKPRLLKTIRHRGYLFSATVTEICPRTGHVL